MSASRHSFGEREEENLEVLVRWRWPKIWDKEVTSHRRQPFPAMPGVGPELSRGRRSARWVTCRRALDQEDRAKFGVAAYISGRRPCSER